MTQRHSSPAPSGMLLPLVRSSGGEAVADAELVRRAGEGERAALQLLYGRHVRAVSRRVTRLLSRCSEAEDVVQDAFVTAFRELGRLQDPARFAPWLLRIAVHEVHRRLRRRRLLARLGLDKGVDDATLERVAAPELSPERRLELVRLDRALATLPADQRLAWMLRYVEGCELVEAAEQCGCSLSTLKRRLGRAETCLQTLLGAHDSSGGNHG